MACRVCGVRLYGFDCLVALMEGMEISISAWLLNVSTVV